MFLLQGSFDDKDWVQDTGKFITGVSIEPVIYFIPEELHAKERYSFKYEHRYEDIYEKIETTISIDQQYTEWCKEGVNHRRNEDDLFYREVEQKGFGITFATFEDYARFCINNGLSSHPSEYLWADGSHVIIVTDYWGDDDY